MGYRVTLANFQREPQLRYTALFTAFVRAEIDLWNSLNTSLHSSVGVTLPQFQALAAVARFDGSARVQDISEEMSITVGATSKVVDRLERDGLATRASNPADRRSSIVKLTPTGLEVLAGARDAVEAHLVGLLGATYSPERAVELTTDLTALRALTEREVAR
jgi:DNA-binding MarR family transcriptional regulator